MYLDQDRTLTHNPCHGAMKWRRNSAVIPKFIKLMSNNQRPTIYGDGTQSRDFTCPGEVKRRRTYVANVVEGNILAATKDIKSGLVMNCACHGQVTLNELVRQINNLLNKNTCPPKIYRRRVEPIYTDPRPGDILHSFADIKKINEQINFEPRVHFTEGINKLIKWTDSL